ncbi:hypothetical protein HK101_004563 [Irineochytrium annulatum]|nr:hypothetical protein HK101_004563 [Irineochytrium annulatum]
MVKSKPLLISVIAAVAVLLVLSVLSTAKLGTSVSDLGSFPVDTSYKVDGAPGGLDVNVGAAAGKHVVVAGGAGAGGRKGSGGLRKPAAPMMSKMGNETLKAELGRASWRLLHTMAGKFPLEPTPEQQGTLLDFIYLFAELYPCGECARHFQLVLEDHPPVAKNRETISQWACEVHNVVNKRLKKPEFDCKTVLEAYKCGCAEDMFNSTTVASGGLEAVEKPTPVS